MPSLPVYRESCSPDCALNFGNKIPEIPENVIPRMSYLGGPRKKGQEVKETVTPFWSTTQMRVGSRGTSGGKPKAAGPESLGIQEAQEQARKDGP